MPIYSTPDNWPTPTYVEPGDGVDAEVTIGDFAAAMEATLTGDDVKTWTPTWGSIGANQPSGVTWTARYIDRQGWRTVLIDSGLFPSGVNGGSSVLYLTLPGVCTAPKRQYLQATLYIGPPTSRYYFGGAQIDSGSNRIWPLFQMSGTASSRWKWRSCDDSLANGTGIPAVTGSKTVLQGGVLNIRGTYRPA